MKRRSFLVMMIPAFTSGCLGLGRGISTPLSGEGAQPEPSGTGIQDGRELGGGESHSRFMERARDRRQDAAERRRDRRREAAKKRRDRRERLARARRRRRNRGD